MTEEEDLKRIIRLVLDEYHYHQEQLYTPAEAADKLRISKRTLSRMSKCDRNGEIKLQAYLVGNLVRYKNADLERLTSCSPVSRHVRLRPSVNSRPFLNQAA